MTLQTVTETNRVTASYERKVNLGNYESETFTAWCTIPVPWDADVATRLGALDQAFKEARAAVEEAMTGGPKRIGESQPAAQQPDLRVVPNPQETPLATREIPQTVTSTFPGAEQVPSYPSKEHLQYLLDNNLSLESSAEHGGYYDNRATADPERNQPHFRSVVEIDGEKVPIWPIAGSNPVRYA